MTDGEPPAVDARDSAFMRRALDLATKGWGQTAPNPMVGAVVVREGVVVGEGYHAHFGGDHAEIAALRAAGALARGATVYVSLEPCAHHGKTPPCADALIAAGVSRVVAAVADPNPKAGGGAARLRAGGIDVDVGVEEDAARELNAPFFHAFASADRPWVIVKLALSVDGAIADARRSAGWLTGPEARREVHRLRAGADAVAVGIGTALADDPLLTVRDAPPPRAAPARVVFDSTFRLPLSSRLARTAGEVPTIVVTTRDTSPDPGAEARARALAGCGVRVVRATSLAKSLRALRDGGIRALLVEGGARLVGSLLSAGALDRLIIFQAPLVLGAGALNAFASAPAHTAATAPRFAVLERKVFGDDLMTVYAASSP